MSTLALSLLAFVFVLLNGFFVLAEFSIVKIRHTKIETFKHTKGFRGKILAHVHQSLDSYLSACQLGITLASLGLGWIGEPAFAQLLMPVFEIFDIKSLKTINFLSFLFAFGIITYLHIVVGELMPKSMAIRQTEVFALWTAVPLYWFYWLMFPAIWVLNASANLFLKIFRLDKIHTESLGYTSQEINLILKTSHRYGEISQTELDLLTKSLIFTDLEISDVMQPLVDMVSLDLNQPMEALLKKIGEKRYTRYPVYKDNPKNIVGILHIKDLFPVMQKSINIKSDELINKPTLKIKELVIRPILKIKENDNLLDIFHQFRKGRPHFALVSSETHPIGFVTLDDILQAIIGDIKDEFHITTEDWIMYGNEGFIIKGTAPVFTLEKLVGVDLPVEANTVSGLIFDVLQAFPKEGEKIEFDTFTLIVKKIRGQRILQVLVYNKPKTDEDK